MTKIFFTNAIFDYESFKCHLHVLRRNELEGLKNEGLKNEKTTVSLLLDYALFKLGFLTDLPAKVIKKSDAKPYLTNGSAHFNLSHSRGSFACAVSDATPLGLDVEAHKTTFSGLVAKKIFQDGELSHFNSLPPDERAAQFYKKWVITESLLKLSGEGIKGVFKGASQLTKLNENKYCADKASIYYYYINNSHIACALNADTPPEIEIVKGKDIENFLNSKI